VEYALMLLPVLLLLLAFYLLDSFRLVKVRMVAILLAAGIFAAAAAYVLNGVLSRWLDTGPGGYSRYIAPLLEELLKALPLFYLIRRKKIGLAVDAAICGFSSGAGFALAENLYYLAVTPHPGLAFWTLRGFGTAIMHSGATSLLAAATTLALNREKNGAAGSLTGLLLAYLIHSAFNHFYINPVHQTILILILVPAGLILMFRFHETRLRSWMETEFFTEAELLGHIRKGTLAGSKAGRFLERLKTHYPPETIVDMYNFVSLYLELSITSKKNLLLAECGYPVERGKELEDKVNEFNLLRKQIGKSGELALSPLMRLKHQDLWKITRL